jgi:Trk K+ transport system NAD-binding subunit
VLQQLLRQDRQVVAVDKDANCPFLERAKQTGVPVLVRDMTNDETLVLAGVEHARAILITTDNDLANVEVAVDARRMNPKIRIAMRQFDQEMASKFKVAFGIEFAFSSSALAAPTVASMALDYRVVSAFDVAGVPHVAAEIAIAEKGMLRGRTIGELEAMHHARVLCRTQRDGASESPPVSTTTVQDHDLLLVHASVESMQTLAKAALG